MLPTMNTATARRKSFQDPAAAQAFGLALRARGIEPQVRVNPAEEAVYGERPDSRAAEAEIHLFAERGEELGLRALKWAQDSYWYEGGPNALNHAVSCLTDDLEIDYRSNGAASLAQAGLFLKRLKAALARAPKVQYEQSSAKPATWDIVWDEPTQRSRDTDSDDCWGASVGSDGWRCD